MIGFRESIYSALFDKITSAPGIQGQFKTTARLLQHIEDVDSDQMPALFLLQAPGEKWERKGMGIPAKRTLQCRLIFYICNAAGSGLLPATFLNNCMDAIDDLFNTPAGAVITLNGQIWHAYVAEGNVLTYEGLLQDKSACVVPITMLIP